MENLIKFRTITTYPYESKLKAIEKNHVFPVKSKISLLSLRLIVAMMLILFAGMVTYLLKS